MVLGTAVQHDRYLSRVWFAAAVFPPEHFLPEQINVAASETRNRKATVKVNKQMATKAFRNLAVAAAITVTAAAAGSAPALAWGVGAPDNAYDSVLRGNSASASSSTTSRPGAYYNYAPGYMPGYAPSGAVQNLPSPGPNRTYGVW